LRADCHGNPVWAAGMEADTIAGNEARTRATPPPSLTSILVAVIRPAIKAFVASLVGKPDVACVTPFFVADLDRVIDWADRFEAALKEEGRFTVARSLSVDKERTTLTTLITALFYDLSSEKAPRIPTQGEERERALRELVRRGRKAVVLLVDESHDLHPKTLVGLKRLMEVVADSAGHWRSCWPVTASFAMTCAVPPWRRSAPAPPCSFMTAWGGPPGLYQLAAWCLRHQGRSSRGHD
jgi:hypothetical protein